MSKTTESQEQQSLFQWATYHIQRYPDLQWLHHIPNGGKRDAITAAKLKQEGVKAGVPDICLPVPKGKYHGLYIELKAGKNRTTKNQEIWIKALRANGYCAEVCYGFEAAQRVILDYLKWGCCHEPK